MRRKRILDKVLLSLLLLAALLSITKYIFGLSTLWIDLPIVLTISIGAGLLAWRSVEYILE